MFCNITGKQADSESTLRVGGGWGGVGGGAGGGRGGVERSTWWGHQSARRTHQVPPISRLTSLRLSLASTPLLNAKNTRSLPWWVSAVRANVLGAF